MSDNLGPKKEPETSKPAATPEDDAARRRREELFGDILDEDGADAPEDTVESLRAERDELLQKVAQMTTRLQAGQQDNLTLYNRVEEAKKSLTRAEAKFENDKKFAIEKFVKEVLPVIDTLELGLQSMAKDRESDPKFARMAEGVEKTIGQLAGVFNKFGIKAINPINEEFDSNKHEALATQPKDGVEPETVIHVAQKGYEIEGRVIRPAKVIVTPAL